MDGAFVMASDRGLVTPVGVAVSSLAARAPAGSPLVLLHQGFTADDQAWVRGEAGALDLSFVAVDPARFAGTSLPDHLPPAALFRLLVGSLLDPALGRAVYLDVDILVRSDPSVLFSMAVPTGLGAVRDTYRPWLGGRPFLPWRELGLPAGTPYLNSGVLVIDLERWRSEDTAERCLAVMRRHAMPFGDQDAINLVAGGAWDAIPTRWNVQTDIQRDEALAWVAGDAVELDAARADPGIVHFTGTDKPWVVGPTTPWRQEWFAALDATARSGWRPSTPGAPRQLVTRARRKAARTLGA